MAVEKNRTVFERGHHLAQDRDAVLKLADGAPRAKVDIVALLSLSMLIIRHIGLLTAYQSATYAAEFHTVVKRVRAAETAMVSAGQLLVLAEAMMRNLSKLMAYRGEYEIAHLYTDPAFLDELHAQFEGEPGCDYQFNFWLVPPMMAKCDEEGHLVKQRFGPGTMRISEVSAKLKDLHGTTSDIFGKTGECHTKCALIGEYYALVDELAKGLTAQKLAQAVEPARLPGDIRGFGHVKETNLAAACIRWNKLTAQWRGPAAAQRAA